MYASPLIRTLQMLTLEELESLHPFVASPIFNIDRKGETLQLFEYLKRFYPDFNQPELDRDTLSVLFYGHTQNPLNALQKAMSTLFNVVKKFITFKYTIVRDEAETDTTISLHEIQQQLSLLRYYGERQSKIERGQPQQPEIGRNRRDRIDANYFINLYNKTQKDLTNKIDFTDFSEYEFSDYYYFKFMLQFEKGINDTLQGERRSDWNLLNTIEQLDEFYLIAKLRLVAILIHGQRMSLIFPIGSPELQRLEEMKTETLALVAHLGYNLHSQKPVIKIYCLLLDFLMQIDPIMAQRKSEELNQYIKEWAGVLPRGRLAEVYGIVSSFWR